MVGVTSEPWRLSHTPYCVLDSAQVRRRSRDSKLRRGSGPGDARAAARSVGDIDSAIDEISGVLISRRDLGEWRKMVRRMLEKNYLAEFATVIEP